VIPGHITTAGGLIVIAGLGVLVCVPPEARALEWAGKVGEWLVLLGLIVAGIGLAWGLN
jgi:hypothetical protein